MTDDWVGAGEPIPRLKSARAIEPFGVEVEWEHGDIAVIDLTPLIQSHQAFHLLMGWEVFATLSLDDWGWGIYWPSAPLAAIPTTTLQDLQMLALRCQDYGAAGAGGVGYAQRTTQSPPADCTLEHIKLAASCDVAGTRTR